MILTLRQRHRRIFGVLVVLMPIAVVCGIAARKMPLHVESLPFVLSPQMQPAAITGYKRLFPKYDLTMQLWEDSKTRQHAVNFVAPDDLLKPDLLVYWHVGGRDQLEGLPSDATLLGSFVATTLTLPAEASAKEGVLILFSLADQEIVDISKPFVVERGSPNRSASAAPAAIKEFNGSLQLPAQRLTEPRSGQ